MQKENLLANSVATLLHPLLLPIYCTLLVLYGTGLSSVVPFSYKMGLLLNVGISSSILPLIAISIFIKTGRVLDIEMRTLEERPLPLLTCGLVVLVALTVSRFLMTVPRPLVAMEVAMGLILGVAGFVSHWWQISLHTLGAGAFLSFVISLGTMSRSSFTSWAAMAFILGGLSAWSRLKVNAHTPSQLMVGYLTGMSIMSIIMFLCCVN